MVRKRGFTLIELLVVLAIISILAGIVVPRIGDWVSRARATRALGEVKNIDLSLTKMLTDVNKKNFRHFFDFQSLADFDALGSISRADQVYWCTNAFYALLRQGRTAQLGGLTGLVLKDDVRQKLGSSYMDLAPDPWGNLYQFYMGPWKSGPIPFRSYRGVGYVYNVDAKTAADREVPGNPPADGQVGYPAPKTLSMYVYSYGDNMTGDQLFDDIYEPDYEGGGDDINNWDNEQGWSGFYN